MTLAAFQFVVNTRQSEIRVKALGNRPATLRMAFLALFSEIPFMDVFVAVHASLRNIGILNHRDFFVHLAHEFIFHGFMTFLAGDFGMFVTQRVVRILGVVELRDLPLRFRVTFHAIAAELSFMDIGMAREAVFIFQVAENIFGVLEGLPRGEAFDVHVRGEKCHAVSGGRVAGFALRDFMRTV